jgi:hypothetical protein
MKYSVTLFSITFLLFLAGCASQKAIPTQYALPDDEKYIPINLDVSAGRYISEPEAQVVNYIYDSFDQSGLFADIETSVLRWPYTIVVKHSWEQPMDASETAGTLVSAATLLVVPGFFDELHTLEVEILAGNALIKALTYTQEIETALSLYHRPVEDRKQGINVMLNQLFSDLEKEGLIPTVADIKIKKQQKTQTEFAF